ncbi:MAG: hypothetical protein H6807_16310 [Planctomycetes bacterium]|nr:hypothetical protein [Planctomycetota bacterium]
MMKRAGMAGLLLVLALSAFSSTLQAQKAPKIKETVTFAQSWDKAVEEAKLLNVPIVVHSHGFY